MFCPSCNAPNREDAKFCKSCGLRFEQGKAPVQSAVATEQPASPASAENHDSEVTRLDPEATLLSKEPWDEDIALAPTLVLSHEQIEEMMARRNRSSGALEQEESSMPTLPANEPSLHPADMPTIIMPLENEMPTLAASEAINPLADMPTISTSAGSESNHAPDSPPLDSALAITSKEDAEQKEALETMSEQSTSHPDASQGAEHSPAEEGPFAPLAVGTMLAGRYEITQTLPEDADEHTYQVIDRQGYQHCWNCGSQENAEGDEFCISCGASMLNVPYILHEYPATGKANSEAAVMHGAIVNTFIEQGRTYAVEQPALSQSAFPNGVHLLAAGGSDAGDVRRSEPNEDSTLVLQLQRIHESNATPTGIFIVADGMGGHDYGQVASRMAINTIAERMTRELLGAPLQGEQAGEKEQPLEEDDLVGLLRNTIEEANLSLCQKNQREKTDMGCTLTGFMIIGEHAYIANVGDSRTYMVRGGQIYKLTSDHSLVGQLVAGGLIEPDDVYTHPQRSQIFRSLGDKPNVQIDIFKQQLLPGDILLSCSDGLWEMVRDPQIESTLNTARDPQDACSQLIELANANGGEDNVSAVIAFVR